MNKKKQGGFSLIEIGAVIILLVVGLVWGGYFLKQEKELSEMNVVATQLNGIANDVANFNWHVPSTFDVPYVYNINELIDKGVVSARDYVLKYAVLMYWRDKYTYDVLVYVESPPEWDLKQLKEISNMAGFQGGYVDAEGQIKMNASSLIKKINPIVTVKLVKNSPIVLYQVSKRILNEELPFTPKIVRMGAVYTEWGNKKRLDYITNQSITWRPAYVTDVFGFFWGTDSMVKNQEMTVRISDANTKEILRTQVSTNNSFTLTPSLRLLGKALVIDFLYKNEVLMTRNLIINEMADDGVLTVSASLGIYRNSVTGTVIRETKRSIAGPYFFFCPYTFGVTTNDSGGELINPIIYNVQLALHSTDGDGKIKKYELDIDNIYVKSIPYEFSMGKNKELKDIIPFCTQFARPNSSTSSSGQMYIRNLNTGGVRVEWLSSPITISWSAE